MTSTVPHQALYRRWRAQTFAQIVGQEAVVETLRNAVRADRVSHAILFVGPRGTGKTSLARILAKAVNCTNLQDGDACDACPSCVSIREGTTLDLIEIDAASNRGIDDVRGLRERLPYPPGQLKRKVYILDEAHQITRDAWNALLKSLEEPPDFVIFMFASTEPSGFPPAILSRLQRFDVRRLTVPEIEGKLRRILAADGREADDGAIGLIARLAAGGMRDAESMLDQLLSSAPDRIDEAHVRDLLGLADAEVIEAFVDHLVRGDAAAGVALLDALDERGRDVRALLDQVVDAIRLELVAGLADRASARHDPAELAAAGRRIAAIDPNRAGIGGLRFQLELALFRSAGDGVAIDRPGPSVASRDTQSPEPASVQGAATSTVSARAQAAPEPERTPANGPARARDDGARATEPVQETSVRPGVPSGGKRPSAPPAPAPAISATPPITSHAPTVAATPAAEAAAAATPATATPAAGESATETPVAAASASGALDELLAAWPAIVAQLSAHPPTKPLVIACRPVNVDGGIVTLGFPEEQAFLKDAAERRRPAIEAGIGAVLGRPVTVRCVVANIEVAAGPADAAYVLAEARRIFADDIVDVGEVS
ncbi:MAG TPA: DNA polymerase III subunit gamma/tau [Candidatus Limnocylindrales bacterium]|nr:DNA polymerase III subunit gamma/tau [Candidatus Limnocylindrales bacterium]